MKRELGEEYVILLRLHYLVSENLDLSAHEGFAYDLSSYEDISHLYLISDLLITDYSSVFFDYANLQRPMLFYVYDIENYRDKLRGFYFDFEKNAPGLLVKTSDAVIDSIKTMKYENTNDINHFHERFCALEDGQASRRVVEKVFLGRSV
jgi:CDP-glycerol glycerophosphotransferase